MGHLLVLSITQLAWGIILFALLCLLGIFLHDAVVNRRNRKQLERRFRTASKSSHVVVLPSRPAYDFSFDKITEYRNDFS